MRHKKLLFTLLASSILLWSCNNIDSDTEGTVIQETSIQVPTEISLYENGSPLYTIVKPDNASDLTNQATSLIWNTFMDSFDCEMSMANDWVSDPAEIPVGTPEILIGATNRPESAEAIASLGDRLYRVTCQNNRIIIVAKTDSQLENAANAFLAAVSVDENGRITVPADLDLSFSAKDAWPHDDIPYYEGGSFSGLTAEQTLGGAREDPSVLVGIHETNEAEFTAYIEMLKNDGFTALLRTDENGIIAYQCDKDEISLYAYYTAATNEVRIIREKGKSLSIEEFGYTYEPKEGETTDVFLFGLRMQTDEIDYTANYNNNGQFLFIKLADNSLLLIDGGAKGKETNERPTQIDFDEFLRIAREVTGTPENEKIRIACWFITHPHADHFASFRNQLNANLDLFTVERVMYNLYDGDGTDVTNDSSFTKYLPDALYHKPHTGETIQLGNLTLEVLYSQEDWMDTSTMLPSSEEVNDSGTVLKIHFDDKTFMVLGDIDVKAAEILQTYYPADVLKADVVQIAHHGYNNIRSLYEAMDAKIGLVPQTYVRLTTQPQLTAIYNSLVSNFDELYYAGDETVGVRVIDGELQVFYRSPVIYKPTYD